MPVDEFMWAIVGWMIGITIVLITLWRGAVASERVTEVTAILHWHAEFMSHPLDDSRNPVIFHRKYRKFFGCLPTWQQKRSVLLWGFFGLMPPRRVWSLRQAYLLGYKHKRYAGLQLGGEFNNVFERKPQRFLSELMWHQTLIEKGEFRSYVQSVLRRRNQRR